MMAGNQAARKLLLQSITNTDMAGNSQTKCLFNFFCFQRSKQRLSKELSDCVVYCKSVHFSSFKHSRIHSKFYEVASFTEPKARKHLREAGMLLSMVLSGFH